MQCLVTVHSRQIYRPLFTLLSMHAHTRRGTSRHTRSKQPLQNPVSCSLWKSLPSQTTQPRALSPRSQRGTEDSTLKQAPFRSRSWLSSSHTGKPHHRVKGARHTHPSLTQTDKELLVESVLPVTGCGRRPHLWGISWLLRCFSYFLFYYCSLPQVSGQIERLL